MKSCSILFTLLILIKCQDKELKIDAKPIKKMRNTESKDNLREDYENINILLVSYELTYDNRSVLKVILRTVDDLEHSMIFFGMLKVEGGRKVYRLKCYNVLSNEIECYSDKNVDFDPNEKYYFYYKNNGKLTFDEKEEFEDYKRVTLVFKPDMYENQIMWKDHRKILGLNHRKIVSGGYLYIVPKTKKLLPKAKDGFNQYIELNNFISLHGLSDNVPKSTLSAFKEAIRRGFHIVHAELQFTKDKVPVIMHTKFLEKCSDGDGKIEDTNFKDLKKLDFGSIFSKKFAGEKILTFEDLLILCKENNVIIDLDFRLLDHDKYFEKTDEYAKIIVNTVEKNEMIDSVIFNNDQSKNLIYKLLKVKNELAISLLNVNKDDLTKIKEAYPGPKRIIISYSDLEKNDSIDEEKIKYAISLGYKVKVSIVDDEELAKNLISLGVSYISTTKLHPFQIQNDYEIPLFLKCTQFDILADCRFGPEVKLIDNEVYNIYYSENIYNLYENINEKPIGEFKYLDTKKLDDLYYTVRIFDFPAGYLKLNSSVKVERGKYLTGLIGPTYENVSNAYLYRFFCDGNNKYDVHCKIIKDDPNIVPYKGNYTITVVDNYSLYIQPKELKQNTFFGIDLENNKGIIYFPIIAFIVIAVFIFIYAIKSKKDYFNNEISYGDSVDIRETAELNN